jgi:hypothetical protein
MKEFAGENLLKDFRFVHLILGGAALQRCGNCAALAAEATSPEKE